jgi:hypothetical protein
LSFFFSFVDLDSTFHALFASGFSGKVEDELSEFVPSSSVSTRWSTGAGADVMKHIAAPMIGGIITSFLLELVVYPVVYQIWKWNFEIKRQFSPALTLAADANAVSSFR